MLEKKHRLAVIGCGRLGQSYLRTYSNLFPNVEIVALAEVNPERLKHVGETFGVKALYRDAEALFSDMVPDIAAVVTPTKYMKDAVIAAAQAGVKGVSTDKPIAATLADADAMVEACRSRGVIYSGGALMTAVPEVQEAASWIRQGRFGKITGAAVHNWSGEISGGGCHHVSVLRLLTGAEITEVIAWGTPPDILAGDCDWGLSINGRFKLSNGIDCPVFGQSIERGQVDVWNDETFIRMPWAAPDIYRGFDANGSRVKVETQYTKYEWPHPRHLAGSIRGFLDAVEARDESKLWISGFDLRQALEAAVAAHESAKRGAVPLKLPLEDRSLTLYPRPYRWVGGDLFTGKGEKVEGHRQDLDI